MQPDQHTIESIVQLLSSADTTTRELGQLLMQSQQAEADVQAILQTRYGWILDYGKQLGRWFIDDIFDFQRLTYLVIEKYTNVHTLPPNLKELEWRECQLDALPTLPEGLEKLKCANLGLQTLPDLPKQLKRLDCANNQLTALPPLPATLIWLNCLDNPLTTLPPLPPSLRGLLCAPHLKTKNI